MSRRASELSDLVILEIDGCVEDFIGGWDKDLFDLPLCIPYNENDKDGKNASKTQTESMFKSSR